jgi:hypothetical protein
MSQLGYKGMTDSKGNYTITGFPYKSEGTLYTFTPMLGVHSFDPMQRLKFIGDGESIHNDVDFKDVSSFKVAGNIRYQNSKFPVEGVSFYIDGKVAVDGEGNTILTDRLGQFRIDVPIGPHSIQAKMNFHGFAGEGRFPGKDSKGNIMKFDFQQPLSGLEFIDTTLVKVAGRVVGGPVEGQKALGFGISKNNLGEAAIYLTSEKGYDLTLKDSTKTYSEKYIKTSAEFTTKNVTVNPDPGTGEYVMYLPRKQ